MRGMRQLFFWWSLGVLFLVGTSRVLGTDSNLRELFLSEYRQAYHKLIQNYTSIEYSYRGENPSGKGLVQMVEAEGKFDLNLYLLRSKGWIAKSDTREIVREFKPVISGGNTKYAFEVVKRGEGYLLRNWEPASPSGRVQFMPFIAPIADQWTNRTYLEIAEDPETKFLEMRDTEYRGRKVKQLKVVVSHLDIVTKQPRRTKKSYFFDPMRGWVCVGWTHDIGTGTCYLESHHEYEGEVEYPPLKVIELGERDHQNSKHYQFRWRIEFIRFERLGGKLDESEFRLSAFGLPEPVGVEWERPVRWYLWLMLAGVVCLLAGGVFYSLSRRRAGGTS
ncbi:MAG: hypothetical protein KatS3mg107_0906 [Gemmataceae bacterium]|nr:MAG: hypothetical protein KatS3mg107_0906 [Gemmataceae bacterium]